MAARMTTITTTSADHGILHEASPPAPQTAAVVARHVDLLQLERQLGKAEENS